MNVCPGLVRARAVDESVAVAGDAIISQFAGNTYRASLCEMRQVDMLLLAALATIHIMWPPLSTSSEAAMRGSLNVLVLSACAWYVGTRNPFLSQDGWKLYVKVGSLLLAALAAVLTHYTLAETLQSGPSDDAGTSQQSISADSAMVRTALSYSVFAGCVLLMGTLAVGFWTSAISGAHIDEQVQQAQAAEAVRRARESMPVRAHHPVSVGEQPNSDRSGGRLSGRATMLLEGAAMGAAGLMHNPLASHKLPGPSDAVSAQGAGSGDPSMHAMTRRTSVGPRPLAAAQPRRLSAMLPYALASGGTARLGGAARRVVRLHDRAETAAGFSMRGHDLLFSTPGNGDVLGRASAPTPGHDETGGSASPASLVDFSGTAANSASAADFGTGMARRLMSRRDVDDSSHDGLATSADPLRSHFGTRQPIRSNPRKKASQMAILSATAARGGPISSPSDAVDAPPPC